MLVGASMLLAVLGTCGLLLMRHLFLIRYTSHTLLMWLALDAAIFAVGLALQDEHELPRASAHRSTRSHRRLR
jgi:hypothetical protein